eukprot:815350-Pyramimonas_sp.AAC.1
MATMGVVVWALLPPSQGMGRALTLRCIPSGVQRPMACDQQCAAASRANPPHPVPSVHLRWGEGGQMGAHFRAL